MKRLQSIRYRDTAFGDLVITLDWAGGLSTSTLVEDPQGPAEVMKALRRLWGSIAEIPYWRLAMLSGWRTTPAEPRHSVQSPDSSMVWKARALSVATKLQDLEDLVKELYDEAEQISAAAIKQLEEYDEAERISSAVNGPRQK